MDATKTPNPEITGDAEVIDTGRMGFGVDDHDEEEAIAPPALELDDHHMQVRALNLWAGLLDDRRYPPIEALSPADDPDLVSRSVLIEFAVGNENPEILYLGEKLAEQCEVSQGITRLEQAPGNSLLARLADYYMPVFESRAPRDFEAEYENSLGDTVVYRGIMLPFSSDDNTIDFIFGVINSKVVDKAYQVEEDQTESEVLLLDQELQIEERSSEVEAALSLDQGVEDKGSAATEVRRLEADSDRRLSEESLHTPPLELVTEANGESPAGIESSTEISEPEEGLETYASDMALPQFGHVITLGDWLTEARESALAARSSEERSRKALYEAISGAYDFSLAATEAPEEFGELLREAGLAFQERAPMTPVVKLVFGLDYDRTRLAEYAAALSHAHRLGIERGNFGEVLTLAQGGLKGVISAERRLRREESGRSVEAADGLRPALAKKLLKIPPQSLSDLSPEGVEFTLVLAHRLPSGEVAMLGEIPHDIALLERAARRLVSGC